MPHKKRTFPVLSGAVARISLALLCCLLWGGVIPAIKIGNELLRISNSESGKLLLFAGTRFSISGILLILFCCVKERRIVLPKKEEILPTFLLGATQTMGQYTFFYIGMAQITGVKSSVMVGANTFAAILMSSFLFHQEQFTRKKLVSCLIGFSGIVIANLRDLDLSFTWNGEGFILISMAFFGLGSCLTKKYGSRISITALSGYQFLIGGILLVSIGNIMGAKLVYDSAKAIAVLLLLAVFAAAAQTLWSALLKYNSVSSVSIFLFSIPVFGVFLSSLLLVGEEINSSILIALVLVCAGIILSNLPFTE